MKAFGEPVDIDALRSENQERARVMRAVRLLKESQRPWQQRQRRRRVVMRRAAAKAGAAPRKKADKAKDDAFDPLHAVHDDCSASDC